jgi:ATP-dependent Clp protease adapter protein ClpS
VSRTAIYRSVYFGLLAAYVAIALWVVTLFHSAPLAIFTVAGILLIPGRILSFYWRDLLQGLRLLNEGKYAQSKARSESFLLQLQAKPWIRRLIWVSGSRYSRNPEVWVLNNLGAAEMRLGEMDSARQHLQRAIELDGECPLPYFNMGSLLVTTGKVSEAEEWFAAAAKRGYRKRKPRTPGPSQVFPPETSLLTIPKFVPHGFVHGVEILNDNTTPMEFVVSVLGVHLGLSEKDAIRTMLAIHEQGGVLLAMPLLVDAKRVTEAVSMEAAKHNHSLICRAVSIQ